MNYQTFRLVNANECFRSTSIQVSLNLWEHLSRFYIEVCPNRTTLQPLKIPQGPLASSLGHPFVVEKRYTSALQCRIVKKTHVRLQSANGVNPLQNCAGQRHMFERLEDAERGKGK